MDINAFELGENIDNQKIEFKLTSSLWEEFNINNFCNIEWTEIKYLNIENNGVSEEITNIPNDKGGIYQFIIKPNNGLSNICEFLVYVGRAKCTDTQNLRKRCREYYNHYSNNVERPKIHKMFKYWGKHLYYRYYPMIDNEEIVELEAELINSLLPPFNSEIPNKIIRDAVNAF